MTAPFGFNEKSITRKIEECGDEFFNWATISEGGRSGGKGTDRVPFYRTKGKTSPVNKFTNVLFMMMAPLGKWSHH